MEDSAGSADVDTAELQKIDDEYWKLHVQLEDEHHAELVPEIHGKTVAESQLPVKGLTNNYYTNIVITCYRCC